MGIWHNYFMYAAEIWSDYYDGKINLPKRDAQLNKLRAKWGIS